MAEQKHNPIITFIKWLLVLLTAVFGLHKLAQTKTGQKKLNQVKKKASKAQNSFHKRCKNILKDFLIPHDGNDHYPKGLRAKALGTYVGIIVLVKVLVTGSLFFIYPNYGYLSDTITEDLFQITNEERIANGLSPLSYNDELERAAQAKVDDMIAQNYFSHYGPDGSEPWSWIDTSQYQFIYMGENLAMDFSSAAVVHSAFMSSESHKKNILHDKYSDIGIAMAAGEINGRETLVLAQFYAKPKFTPAVAVAPHVAQAETVEIIEKTIPAPKEPIEPIEVPAVEPIVTEEPVQETEVPEEPTAAEQKLVIEAVPTFVTTTPTTTTSTIAQTDREPTVLSSAQLVVTQAQNVERGLVDLLVSWSRNFMVLMLTLVIMLLLINILIRAHIQHARVIVHSLIVIALMSALILTRVHMIERFII